MRMSFHQALVKTRDTFTKKMARTSELDRGDRLSDGMVRHISRDTQEHSLTSILTRQIVDAQFRLARLTCEEERYEQICLIDDLMRRRAREIRGPMQFA